MSSVSKISSGAVAKPLARRLPAPVAGIDLNFCRNPACALYGVAPDPFKRPHGTRPAPPGVPRGVVAGKKHEEHYQCPACRTTSRIKNNRAVAEEYERLCRLRKVDPCAPACRNAACANEHVPVAEHPEHYQRFGNTKAGDPRWRCKGCARTFSVGKPTRRHKRLRTSNPIERSVQQELKRRTVKIRVFPSEDALLRLVSAVLVEIDEKWASDTKAYIKWECQDA